MRHFAVLLLTISLAFWSSAGAQGIDSPYRVSVWARVLFGTDGKPVEYALVDEDKYPSKFAENVRQRIAGARIRVPEIDGQPATLRSGVELQFEVVPTAEGGTVRLEGIEMNAMPIKKYYASYPKDIAMTEGWDGEATGLCRIGADGKCSKIEVSAHPGMPTSVRKHVRASLEQWEFEPQAVNGRPVEGEYKLTIRYNTLDVAPGDFRQDKFQRILRGR